MEHNTSPQHGRFSIKGRLYPFLPAVYVFTILCGASPMAMGATTTGQNSLFADAVTLMADERWVEARTKTVQSGDPALARIYEWMLYREDGVTGLPFDRVATFIQTYPNWPEMGKIRATAERVMPGDYPLASMVAWFEAYPPATAKGMMTLINAADTTTPQTTAIINRAWPELNADPHEQDALLERVGSTIAMATHDERLDRLLHNQQYTLARSLGRFLGRGYPMMVEARIALIEDKQNAPQLVTQVPATMFGNAGFILDRVKWREDRGDDKGAIDLLTNMPPASFNHMTYPDEWWKERAVLARQLIEERNPRTAYAVVSNHHLREGASYAEAEWFAGWLALRFLNKPDVALQHFIHMYGSVETAISKARGAYWAGRASEKIPEQAASATTWFEAAANYPHTYYGQLATRHLGRDIQPLYYTPSGDPHSGVPSELTSPLVDAAIKLREAGQEKLGTLFLNAALTTVTNPNDFQVLAQTLSRYQDISGAYRVAKAASWKNILLTPYYTPSLQPWMAGITTDNALLHGLIRQESQFDTDATSPSGALGLTQLMPATARETADKAGMDYNASWLTSRPSYNIRIGAAYMDKLLERFNGSYPLAIAAYNAGPRRVSEWLDTYGDPRGGRIDWIDWLEMIPVSETRNYVQRVTEGTVFYRHTLKTQQNE